MEAFKNTYLCNAPGRGQSGVVVGAEDGAGVREPVGKQGWAGQVQAREQGRLRAGSRQHAGQAQKRHVG